MGRAGAHSHIARNTDPPHGSHEGMLEGLPGDTVVFDMWDTTASKRVLFLGEEPPPRRARQARPESKSDQGDWKSNTTLLTISSTLARTLLDSRMMNPHLHPAKPKAPSRFRFAALRFIQPVLCRIHEMSLTLESIR